MEQSGQAFPTQQAQQQELLRQQQIENSSARSPCSSSRGNWAHRKKRLSAASKGEIIGFDNDLYQKEALAAGVPLPTITAQQQAITEAATKAQALTADELKNHETQLDQHFQTIEGLRKFPAGPRREQEYQKVVNKSRNVGRRYFRLPDPSR